MNTTISKIENEKLTTSIEQLFQDAYNLSKWEKIKEFSIAGHSLIFQNKIIDISLYRKFSNKNYIEKYMLKDSKEKLLAKMDVKVYKDSLYIISLQIYTRKFFDQVLLALLQVSVEKSMYNTTKKEVYINIQKSFFKSRRLRKAIIANSFIPLNNQSNYEKELFGEAFQLNISNSPSWLNRIKYFQLLTNK